MARRRSRENHDTIGVVLLVLGILLVLGGLGSIAEGAVVNSAANNLGGAGGLLGNMGSMEETLGGVFLVLGIAMISMGAWLRR